MKIDTDYLLARFLDYVQIGTRSDPDSPGIPSTPEQWDLLRRLVDDLKATGVEDVALTDNGYVLARIPATSGGSGKTRLGFFAHVDTAPDLPSAATPIVHRTYDGGVIRLPDDTEQILDPGVLPHLSEKIGEDIVTASGKSLLGADDKSGVAVLMAVVHALCGDPSIEHGPLVFCFNPDEEIARGVDGIEVDAIGAEVAYTLDGELPGEIDAESFSADEAILEITGVAAHPGWAKDVLVNALRIAGRFLDQLPTEISPEKTDQRDGFIHPSHISGSADRVLIRMILRDFELDGLEAKRQILRDLVASLQKEETSADLKLTINKQYRNMRYWLEEDTRPVDVAVEAVRAVGLEPKLGSIRGGTDGSRLTERGLPTPNIFCGFHEVHSQREWVSLQDMMKSAETVLQVIRIWNERG
jgi:tripeptide aminopeptidase